MSISDIEIILNFYKEFKEKNVKEKNMIKNSIDKNVEKILNLFEQYKKDISQLSNKGKEINFSETMKLDEKINKKIEEIKNREYKIFVTGEAKSGKSTFINAFLGEDILPTGFIQCTSSIIEIRRSKDEKKRLISEEVGGGITREENIDKIKKFLKETAAIPDEYRDIPFNIINDNFLIRFKDNYTEKDLNNFISEIKKEKVNNLTDSETKKGKVDNLTEEEFENKVRKYIKNSNWRKVIKRIILEYPLEKLKEVTIFDTPGVGAEGSIGDITKKYIKDADAIIFIKSVVGQDIESTSFTNFLNENITDDKERSTFLVFTRKNDTKEGDIEQFEKRLEETFYKKLKRENIFILDSLTELKYKEYQKFSTGEELEIYLKEKEKWEEWGVFNGKYKSDLDEFIKGIKKDSAFYKFRDKIDEFADKAHYLKLISFLDMLKKNCEKEIGKLNLIIKSCEGKKGNLQEIKKSIEDTKRKIKYILNAIRGDIPSFRERYIGTDGSITKIAKDLLNFIVDKIEKVAYTEATSYKNIIEKELENFYNYTNDIKEKELKKFIEEINNKILEENKKLDLSLNALLPNFDDEEIKEIFEKANKDSEYYEDTTGMIRSFFNFVTFGFVERTKELRKDKDKEKKLIVENIKTKCKENIYKFENILQESIKYGIKEYEKVLKKNAENTQIQLDLFLSNLKTTEEAIKQINLAEEIVKFYKEKEIKFSNEIDAIHNIIGKN
ncbi:hypothetical protein FDF23_03745 [Fusobacterium nucleatum]|nr:dynamin family protein [Fusobacterium nucleatum]MBW9310774.1 hypothetical protein [Fusobacterium nucleatum]